MKKRLLLAVVLLHTAITGASASIETARLHIPDVETVGSARMQVLFWKIYDAELYAPDGVWSSDHPYALSLSYLRSFKGQDIVERSIDEIEGQGFNDTELLSQWRDELSQIIPDVDSQTNITGVVDAQGHSLFYANGELVGTVKDPLFSEKFFGIWLSEQTSQPSLRANLIAGDKS